MDTGYWMWSFQGKIIRRTNSNTFCDFKWRPRPPSLLPESRLKEIRKNLKKYTLQFEQKDRIRLTKASKVGFFEKCSDFGLENFCYVVDLLRMLIVFYLGRH
jgi:translation initiation factor 3 subunit B